MFVSNIVGAEEVHDKLHMPCLLTGAYPSNYGSKIGDTLDNIKVTGLTQRHVVTDLFTLRFFQYGQLTVTDTSTSEWLEKA